MYMYMHIFYALPQHSMEVKNHAVVDSTVLGAEPLSRFQFERIGYFCVDFDSKPDKVRVLYNQWLYTCRVLHTYIECMNQMHKSVKNHMHKKSVCEDVQCVYRYNVSLMYMRVCACCIDGVQQDSDITRRLWQELRVTTLCSV